MKKENYLNFFKYMLQSGKLDEIELIVTGNSMAPTFFNNDKIIVKRRDPQTKVKIGDIIVFYKFEDHFTVHRVIKIIENEEGRCYKTKGDNKPMEDNYIVYENEIFGILKI